MKKRNPFCAGVLCTAALTSGEIGVHVERLPITLGQKTPTLESVQFVYQPVHGAHAEAAIGPVRDVGAMVSTATARAIPAGAYPLDELDAMLRLS